MENERIEAYKIYMSDSLVLINTVLSRGEVTIPRYADIFEEQAQKPPETADEIITRFDNLRRDK